MNKDCNWFKCIKYIKTYKFTVIPKKPFIDHLWGLPGNQLVILEIIHSSFIHNIPKLDTAQMSLSRGMDKLWYIHTREYLLSNKTNEPLITTKWMNLRNMLSERSLT